MADIAEVKLPRIVRGDPRTIVVTVVNAAGVAVDLSASTWTSTVRESAASASGVDLTVDGSSAAAGVLSLSFTGAQSRSFGDKIVGDIEGTAFGTILFFAAAVRADLTRNVTEPTGGATNAVQIVLSGASSTVSSTVQTIVLSPSAGIDGVDGIDGNNGNNGNDGNDGIDGNDGSDATVNATNVTAAGALMDSELTSIAAVKALNQSVVSGASPVFDVANMTISDSALVVANETNLQSFANSVDEALQKARGTGVDSTYVAAASGTTFDVPALTGEINSDVGYFRISYGGSTGNTVANLNASSTYVYIDSSGVLQQQTTTPTRQDWSRKLFVMRIGVNTSTNLVIGFEYLNNPLGNDSNSLRDVYTFLVSAGIPFKRDQTITGRDADLGFDVSAGTLLEFGGTGDIHNAHIKTFDAVSGASFNLMTRTTLESSETELPLEWDNATTVTALGSTTWVAHRLFRFSSGNFALQRGQGNYANLVLARAGSLLEDFVLNPALKDATFFGWWFVSSTATNTNQTTLAEFREYTMGVQGGSSSGLSGALLKGNNLGDLLDRSLAMQNLTFASTTTALADIADDINTVGKFVGKQIWNSTTTQPVWAVSAAAGGLWVDAQGTTKHTPA
jgi:hypothetical protein